MTISLDLAITAIRANRREEGRQLLNLLIQQNPNDEMAWLWMSEVVEKDEQRSRCLFHVLAINPDSTVARQGLQRLGIEISASRPVTVEVASETKPVATSADERHPKRLDPKAITQAMPFTPLGETTSEGEVARKKELSNTKQRLRLLTKALMEHESQPVEAVPLPDFDAALAQVKQLPLEKTILLAPSKPMKLPLSGHASRPMGHLGYAAPSQPMHPIQPGFYAPNMFTQLTRPSQPIAMHQAHTMGMPFQSQQIPVIHANTTMGMPYSAPMAYGGVGFHSNATLGMPLPVNAYPPTPSQPQSVPSDRELIAAYQATSQSMRRAPHEAYEEEDEPINIVAVFIFGFLAITALGGAGILILLFMTTWTQ